MCSVVVRLFVFRAEAGIRDGRVTGVQTCALPISTKNAASAVFQQPGKKEDRRGGVFSRDPEAPSQIRSEERRVGKECRSRRSPFVHKTTQHRALLLPCHVGTPLRTEIGQDGLAVT